MNQYRCALTVFALLFCLSIAPGLARASTLGPDEITIAVQGQTGTSYSHGFGHGKHDGGSTHETNYYHVSFDGVKDNTFTYTINSLDCSQSLSHWMVLMDACLENKVTSWSDCGSLGKNGWRPLRGLKWDTTGGTFSFTLAPDSWHLGSINVMADSASYYNTGTIKGPECGPPPSDTSTVPLPRTAWAALGLLGMVVLLRRRRGRACARVSSIVAGRGPRV